MDPLTPQQVAEVVAHRLLAPTHPGTAVRWRIVQADPCAAALARRYHARLRTLVEHAQDPVERFEHMTGRTWPPSPIRD